MSLPEILLHLGKLAITTQTLQRQIQEAIQKFQPEKKEIELEDEPIYDIQLGQDVVDAKTIGECKSLLTGGGVIVMIGEHASGKSELTLAMKTALDISDDKWNIYDSCDKIPEDLAKLKHTQPGHYYVFHYHRVSDIKRLVLETTDLVLFSTEKLRDMISSLRRQFVKAYGYGSGLSNWYNFTWNHDKNLQKLHEQLGLDVCFPPTNRITFPGYSFLIWNCKTSCTFVLN